MSRIQESGRGGESEPADGSAGRIGGRILIAEDEPRIASFIDKGLRANGFTTTISESGADALQLAASGVFDLLVLDLGLPGHDGLHVLRQLRARGQRMPVVMLTARSTVENAVAGLESGADDYVGKPFRFDELLARIRARLRQEPSGDPAVPQATVLRAGEAWLDLRSRQLTIGSTTVELTDRECALAEVFLRYPGEVLSREDLIAAVWGDDPNPASNIVDVYIGYLREKLGAKSIATVRSVGYRWQAGRYESPSTKRAVPVVQDDSPQVPVPVVQDDPTGVPVPDDEDDFLDDPLPA